MGLPSQKRTKSSKRRRASHFALKKTSLGKCPQCGKPQKPHHACAVCDSYKGKTILTIKAKKKTLKQKEQERKSQKQNKKSKKTDA
ncbi:MAG TPA: 50S ribosomal protein L32 [bacterium]|nr:50S ribosomal protein L32 [bacterium]